MRDEALVRSGLTIVRDGSPLPVISPLDAWSKVVSVAAIPTIVVEYGSPDCLLKVDQAWFQTSEREGLFSEGRSFWVHVAGVGALQRKWRKVRIYETFEMASNLGPEPEEPEFVAMALNERVLCGVTTEEDGIWIITARLGC